MKGGNNVELCVTVVCHSHIKNSTFSINFGAEVSDMAKCRFKGSRDGNAVCLSISPLLWSRLTSKLLDGFAMKFCADIHDP